MSSIKHAGGPWELGLTETHQVGLIISIYDCFLLSHPSLSEIKLTFFFLSFFFLGLGVLLSFIDTHFKWTQRKSHSQS